MALPHVAAGVPVRLGAADSTPIERTKSHALVKADRFEAAQLFLPKGTTIPSHSVEGPIMLHCIEGAVILKADRTVRIDAGEWLHLQGGEPHALEALEDSVLLLTIIFP